MPASRDFNVNLKADASNMLQGVQAAVQAFNNLRQVIASINQTVQQLNNALGGANLAAVIGAQTKQASAFVEQWTTDAQGRVIAYGQTIREQLPPGFDAAAAAANQMAAATSQGFNQVRVSVDAAGRMTTKATQDMTDAEQKLAVYINEVLTKLQQMGLSAAQTDQLTSATRRYNDQLLTSKQYLTELTKLQRSATISQEVGARRSQAAMFSTGAMMLYLGRRAYRVGKEIMGTFTDTATAIYKMQLIIGGSAEDLSKIKFAGDQVGVSAKELTARMGLLEYHLARNDQYAKRLGVSYKNLDGSAKPLTQLLGEVGDRLNAETDAFKRSSIAKEVFGRGYQTIMPLVSLGTKGIAESTKVAEKYGQVLDDKGVRSGMRFSMAMKQAGQSVKGLGMALAQSAAPAIATIAHIVSTAVIKFREFYDSANAVGKVVRTIIPLVGLLASGLIGVGVAFRVARIAAKLFNKEMWASPWTWVAAALVAIAIGLVYVAKNFSWGVEVVGYFGAALGGIAGVIVEVGAIVMTVVSGIILGLAKAASWIGKTFHVGWLKDAGNAAADFAGEYTKQFAELAVKAPKAGWEMGMKYGKKAGEAVKNMKLPSLADLSPGGEDTNLGGGGGGGKAKTRIQKMFEDMVNQARDALNALRDKAAEAKKEMDDMSKSVRDSLRSAFSISDIAGEGFVGPKGLMWSMRRRLANMRGFVDNIKRLHQMGLPTDMLMDIVNAGVSGGAEVAKMLVRNPQTIAELASLQSQIVTETAAAGQYVAGVAMGPQVAQYVSEASAYQGRFANLLGQAGRFGYTPTQADIEAATTNIANQVYMDVGTNANPYDIEAAIAWALRTRAVQAGGGRPTHSAPFAPTSISSWMQGAVDYVRNNAPIQWGLNGPTNAPIQWGLQGPHVPAPGSYPMGTPGPDGSQQPGLQGPTA